MNLDGVLLGNALVEEKLGDVLSPVTLQLDDFTELRVRHERAIAVELLLEVFKDFVEREPLGNALDDGPTFATIATLVADVDVIARSFNFIKFGVH